MRLRVGQNFSKKRLFIAVIVIVVLYFAYDAFATEDRTTLHDLPSLLASRPTGRPRHAPKDDEHGNAHDQATEREPEPDPDAPDTGAHRLPTPLHKLQSALDALAEHHFDAAYRCEQADAIAKLKSERLVLPYLLYRCTGFCGGLGDRMRGVLTSFYLALVTGRCFGLNWEHPVNVGKFFHVPQYPHAAHCPSSTCSRREMSHIDHWEPLRNDIAGMDRVKEDVLILRTNAFEWGFIVRHAKYRDVVQSKFPYLLNLTDYELAHLAMRILFGNATALVEEKASAMISLMPKDSFKIGVQIRLSEGRYGNSMEAFKCFARKIAETCKENVLGKADADGPKDATNKKGKAKYNFCAIFITADLVYHSEFQQLHSILSSELAGASVSYKVYMNEVPPSHLDRDGSADPKFHLKTYGDWNIITRMNYLLISRSGFGETSSWYSGVPTFHLDRDRNNMNCRFKENDRSNSMMGILGEGW